MAFTTQQVEKLEDAISNGALLVKYADKEVRYRSLDEMIRLLKLMKQSLGLIKQSSSRTYAYFNKGVYDEDYDHDNNSSNSNPPMIPIIDLTGTTYENSAALNAVYPSAKISQIVNCPNANVQYTKLDNNPTGVWASSPFNTL